MKPVKFDAIVEARSNERVQEKIVIFRNKLTQAFIELGIDERGYSRNIGPNSLKILAFLSINANAGWPKFIWEREREKVASELLDILSPMEQALRSLERISKPDDESAETTTEPKAEIVKPAERS